MKKYVNVYLNEYPERTNLIWTFLVNLNEDGTTHSWELLRLWSSWRGLWLRRGIRGGGIEIWLKEKT